MSRLTFLTGILFVVLVAIGLSCSMNRPFWNDEYYSLTSSTFGRSYAAIAAGEVDEGNNSPLFYLFQKLQCDIFSYKIPKQWKHGSWGSDGAYDRLFLRFQPVVIMSLGLCAAFYYFSRRYSITAGLYLLAVALTSTPVWVHWMEARPYADWFTLTMFQLLLLLNLLPARAGIPKKDLIYLTVIQWLLALTSVVSVIQITAAAAVLFVFRRVPYSWIVVLLIMPLAVACYYYSRAPHYPFFFVNGPVSLINANIPKDRLVLIFGSAVLFWAQYKGKGFASSLEARYLAFLTLMLVGFGVLLLKLELSHPQLNQGFQISNRYFLSLDPAGIIGTVLFSIYLVKAFPSNAWKGMAALILAGFLVFRAHQLTEQISIKLETVPFFKTLV